MMFGMPFYLETPNEIKARKRREKAIIENRLKRCVEWDPKIPWSHWLNIRADTYKHRSLFDIKPGEVRISNLNPEQMAVSRCGRWCYVEKIFPRATPLETFYGSNRGDVVFDGDVIIPALHERCVGGNLPVEKRAWEQAPWMSMTPMEIISLRAGTRLAKGTVVVAGLGMGHQLEEVAKRKKVKHIILVERDESLVEFILPVLELGDRVIEVVIGDAREEVPRLTADVALIDIYRGYGGNEFRKPCPNIKSIWVWGRHYVE